MNEYLDKSGRAMLASGLAFDNARAAEKMADWHCVGADNNAWKEGPYLSAPDNYPEIDHSFPYCFRMSDEFGMIAGIIVGPDPELSENGGVKLPLPPKDKHESQVEPVIAKLAIIEQFELFKEFLITFDGPYSKKRCATWEGRVDRQYLDLVGELTDRRNDLTHDTACELPSMREAVEYFFKLRQLACVLYEVAR